MNIKALFVVIAVAFLVLFGYNYYSGKKREQVIKEMRAETERVTAENARLDAEQTKTSALSKREDNMPTKIPEAQKSAQVIPQSASQVALSNTDGLSNPVYSEKKSKQLEMLGVYKQFVDSSSQLTDLIQLAQDAKGADKDAVLAKMKDLRTKTAVIDTKGDDCASTSKLKMASAIDASIEATQAFYNPNTRSLYTIHNATAKIKDSTSQAKSCMDSLTN